MKPFLPDGLFFNFSLSSPAILSHSPLWFVWFRLYPSFRFRGESQGGERAMMGRCEYTSLLRSFYTSNVLTLNALTQCRRFE